MFGTNIKEVRIEKLNLDLECTMDLINGKGIRITSADAFTKKADKFTKKTEKVWNGLQSPFFGSDFGDNNAFRERWSCKCKKYVGKAYSGRFCERCETYVEYVDIDLEKTGWIILDHFKVISPIYDQKLLAALGKQDDDTVLNKILDVSYDDDGKIIYTDKELNQIDKHPFMHKGMVWLSDPTNLLSVLDWYQKKRPKSQEALFNELRADLFNIFTSCIPVYTSLLRTELPGEKGSKVYKLPINTAFGAITKLSIALNAIDKEDILEKMITINKYLYGIQNEIRNVFDDTYKSFMKKPGIIMSKVIG